MSIGSPCDNQVSKASTIIALRCVRCGKDFDPTEVIYICDQCGEMLDVVYDFSAMNAEANKSELERSHEPICRKYRHFLPISQNISLDLGEGQTPALRCQRIGNRLNAPNIYVKDETRNPTGVFKDRASVLVVGKALEFGKRTVAIASTGNAAASLAAYAARASLCSIVFVPETTPSQKISQSVAYGAKIVRVKGDYDQTYDLTVEACKLFGWYNCSPAINPFRKEGKKTIAYEICEQFNWDPPHWIVVPVGNGCNLAGIWKGFKEFCELGFIAETPRMAAIQAAKAAPLVSAYRKGSRALEAVRADTVAGAIAIGRPRNFLKAYISLMESKGVSDSVTDDEIIEAQALLARTEGIFAEPAGAAAIAGLIKLIDKGTIDRRDKTCCIVTGSGLKDSEFLLRRPRKSVLIEPNVERLQAIRQINS